MWRRHVDNTSPSPHAIRVTCMQLLPLVEMYCRWQLQEDTSNLEALMRRFDSEAELQSHDLGRALLHMVRDDAEGLPVSRSGVQHEEPHVEVADPFHAVREQLAAVGSAFRNLHPQVLIAVVCCGKIRSAGNIQSAFRRFFFPGSYMQVVTTCGVPIFLQFVNTNLLPLAFVPTPCIHPAHFRPFGSLRLPPEFFSPVIGFQCPCVLLLFFPACNSFPCGVCRVSALHGWLQLVFVGDYRSEIVDPAAASVSSQALSVWFFFNFWRSHLQRGHGLCVVIVFCSYLFRSLDTIVESSLVCTIPCQYHLGAHMVCHHSCTLCGIHFPSTDCAHHYQQDSLKFHDNNAQTEPNPFCTTRKYVHERFH